MTVYGVYAGYDCEDWGLEALFSTLEKAEDYAKKLKEEESDEDYTIKIIPLKVK